MKLWSPICALGAATAFAAGAYGAYAGITWLRYGKRRTPDDGAADSYLDRFIPRYDVVERHSIRVSAAADITFSAACRISPEDSKVVRAIFRGRELILRAAPDRRPLPRGLLASTKAMDWGTLAEVPDREIVAGAITQPWKPNVVFQALEPEEFLSFHEPDYVKIAWTLRADPVGSNESIFRSETRAIATGPLARRKFRTYWSFLSPGITMIRYVMLRQVKAEAERRARSVGRVATEARYRARP